MGRTVLVVDDDPAIQRLLVLALESFELEVVLARDGAEAVRLVQEVVPAVIVTDLSMPVMSGEAFLETIRERGTYPPTVVISGTPDGQRIAHRLQADFVAKPFDPFQLAATIADLAGHGEG